MSPLQVVEQHGWIRTCLGNPTVTGKSTAKKAAIWELEFIKNRHFEKYGTRGTGR
jgi:hypothetical protein